MAKISLKKGEVMRKNAKSTLLSSLAVIPVLLAALSVPQTADAGFLWVAPTDPAAQTAAPAPAFADQSAGTMTAPVAPTPIVPASAPAPLPSLGVAPVSPVIVEGHGDVTVSGFANNVPLSVALRQVLPADVGFSVNQDVNLGALVSWKGGGTWRDTLKNMLQPVGLVAKEHDKMVTVAKSGGSAYGSDVSAPVAAAPTATVDSTASPLPKPSLQQPQTQLASISPPPAPMPPAPTPVFVPEHTLKLPASMEPVAGGASIASPVAATPTQEASAEIWKAVRGDMLHKVLEDWSRHAEVELIWQNEYDYPLQASVNMTGSYEDAVRNLLNGFQEAQPQPVAALHDSGPSGQKALVVQVRGNNYND